MLTEIYINENIGCLKHRADNEMKNAEKLVDVLAKGKFESVCKSNSTNW